jgi:hypothetical protein
MRLDEDALVRTVETPTTLPDKNRNVGGCN